MRKTPYFGYSYVVTDSTWDEVWEYRVAEEKKNQAMKGMTEMFSKLTITKVEERTKTQGNKPNNANKKDEEKKETMTTAAWLSSPPNTNTTIPPAANNDDDDDDMLGCPFPLLKAVTGLEEEPEEPKEPTAMEVPAPVNEETNTNSSPNNNNNNDNDIATETAEVRRQMMSLLFIMFFCVAHEYIVSLNLLPIIIALTYKTIERCMEWMFTATIYAICFSIVCCMSLAVTLFVKCIFFDRVPKVKSWYDNLVLHGFGVFWHPDESTIDIDTALDHYCGSWDAFFEAREEIRCTHWWCRGDSAPYLPGEIEMLESRPIHYDVYNENDGADFDYDDDDVEDEEYDDDDDDDTYVM